MKFGAMALPTFAVAGLLVAIPSVAGAQSQAGVNKATGPFTYAPPSGGPTTFLGYAGSATTSFQLCPPGGGAVFAEGDASAEADIRVFGIEKVGDADGNPLAVSEDIDRDSVLGAQIVSAFDITPNFAVVTPGSCFDVAVAITNPGVGPLDYGDYEVTIKAQSPSKGIGVGSGFRYLLKLRHAPATDTTPPDVRIDAPATSSSQILGVIPVQITANDPEPGTGVQTISASISSAGGTVSNLGITFVTNTAPQPAGSNAVATGSFTPQGGTGLKGTSDADPFTSGLRSGIGTYTLTAEAVDGASNVGTASSTFQVKYDVQFTTLTAQINRGNPDNSNVHIKFTVNRSSDTSDGAFIYDTTVVVKLVRTSDNAVVESHILGDGVNTHVEFTDGPAYHTKFRRGEFGATVTDNYKVKVFFLDVDNNLVEQGESIVVTF